MYDSQSWLSGLYKNLALSNRFFGDPLLVPGTTITSYVMVSSLYMYIKCCHLIGQLFTWCGVGAPTLSLNPLILKE